MKNQTQRAIISIAFCAGIFVPACKMDQRATNTNATAEPTPATNSPQQPKDSSAPQAEKPKAVYRKLSSYQSIGKTWRIIVISPNTNKEEIIRLGKELHTTDPSGLYHIYDDDKQIQRFIDANIHYPDPKYPTPESWLRKHYIAMINKMIAKSGAKWQLVAMDAGLQLSSSPNTTVIADLE